MIYFLVGVPESKDAEAIDVDKTIGDEWMLLPKFSFK